MAESSLADVMRRPVFWDENAGGWCYRLRLDRAPVQAVSWAAAWNAVRTYHEHAPAPACCCGTLRPGESCPAHPYDPSGSKPAPAVVPWWRRLW